MGYPVHSLPFVGGLFLLITLLAIHVTRRRVVAGVVLGDGGDKRLGRAIRAHGNSVEHGLLLAVALVLAEVAGLKAAWVVGLGWASLAARLAHAAGFLRLGGKLSQLGMVVTYAVELGLSTYLVSGAVH